MTNYDNGFTQEQAEVLDGLMLGDGALGGKFNKRLQLFRSVKDREYLEYERGIFQNFLNERFINSCEYDKSSPDPRTGKSYPGWFFRTKDSPAFTEQDRRWCPIHKKIVPRDLILSSRTVAHWLADDSYIRNNKPELPYRFDIDIATHGFVKEDVQFLISLLENKYQEEFKLRADKRNDRSKKRTNTSKWMWFIRAGDSASRAVFKDIDPYFKMQRKRIWDRPSSRFYSDQPERQITVVKSFAAKKEKLFKLVSENPGIRLSVLATELGYNYDGRTSYTSINKIIDDSGLYIKTKQPYLQIVTVKLK